MRTRLWLLLVLLLVLAAGAFQYLAKRPSADTVTSTKPPADIQALVNSIELSASRSYAGACASASSLGAAVCEIGDQGLVGQLGVTREFARGVLDEVAEVCLDWSINHSTDPNPGECTTKVPPGTTNGQLNAKMTFDGGEFPLIYRLGKSIDVKATDKADISGSVSGSYTFTNSTDASKAIASLKFDEGSLDGSLKGIITHQVTGLNDYSYYLGEAYPMLDIDKNKSKQLIEFTGLLNYGIDVNFKAGNEHNTETFCPKQCAIWNKNTLILSGSMKKGFDFGGSDVSSTGGLVEINISHEENYKGTGSNKTASFFAWSDDLEIVKNDRRSWNIDVALAQGSPNVNWVGSRSSSANIKPFQKKQLTKTSNMESFAFPGEWRPSGDPKVGLLPPEHNLLLDNLTTQDNNGVISRAGKSSYTVEKSEMYSGIYDNKDARLLVLSRAGRKLNPSERLDDTNGPKHGKFYTSLLHQFVEPLVENNNVSGYFYVGDGKSQATILTPQYQVLPANMLITIGFTKADEKIHDYVNTYTNLFKLWAEARGVNAKVVETRNRSDLLAAWNSATNGTLIFHMGHGGPGFLMAGDEIVSYYDLASIIKNKSVKLAGFFGASCFSASAQGPLSSVAETVVGSAGTGYGGTPSDLGALFGVGTNNFSFTTGKLAGEVLRTFDGGAPSCSSSKPAPTPGPKPAPTPTPTPTPTPGSGPTPGGSPAGSPTTNPPTTVNPPTTSGQTTPTSTQTTTPSTTKPNSPQPPKTRP